MNTTDLEERLYRHVKFLTELNPPRNSANVSSLNKAAQYIKEQFSEFTGNISEQTWTAGGNEYKNIIAVYNPEAGNRIIVGGHYDVCCESPGADDNASAVAGLIETARMVFQDKPELDYGIEFVAYSLEEPPHFSGESMGSYVHAKSIDPEKTLGMVCYEMIGYFSDEPGSQDFPYPEMAAMYPSTGNFIVVLSIPQFSDFNGEVFRRMKGKADIGIYQAIFDDSFSYRSDHINYWQMGIPAVMISDTAYIRNPNYHELTDTIDTLDFYKMGETVKATYNAIVDFNNR